MVLIKTTKSGQKVEVENGWLYLDGKKLSSRVEKIDAWTKQQLDKKYPGNDYEYRADKLIMNAEEGLKSKGLVDAYNAKVKGEQAAKDQAEFDALVASGEAFRTAEITEQYGCDLMWARRFSEEEKAQYSDWFRDRGVCSLPVGGRVKVESKAVRQVVDGRSADAEFCGCSNMAWTITETEWNEIVRLSEMIRAEKEEAKKEYKKAEAASLQRKIDTGYCFSCESWCHGDCGNYSNDPTVSFARELKLSLAEMNYGIKE